MSGSLAVFCDFDGTITDVDVFATLVQASADAAVWAAIDDDLMSGRITFRETLRREAALVRFTRDEALAFARRSCRVDPTFAAFVAHVRSGGGDVTVVSAGIASLIVPLLAEAGVEVPIVANDVDYDPSGWTMRFVDDSDAGHDKSTLIHLAHDRGRPTVFCGDGYSDRSAVPFAGQVFVKEGSPLARWCRDQKIPSIPFTSFADVIDALRRSP